MGQNKRHLSQTTIVSDTIFPKRMIVECDETIHIHWRNLRLELSDGDFLAFASMIMKALAFYKMNDLHTQDGQHIEMARADVTNPQHSAQFAVDEQVNLYKKFNYDNAEFYEEEEFIVIRLRDLRIEMSKEEFKQIANSIGEANEELK